MTDYMHGEEFINRILVILGIDPTKLPVSQVSIISGINGVPTVNLKIVPDRETAVRILDAMAETQQRNGRNLNVEMTVPPDHPIPLVLGEDCKVTPAGRTIRMPDGEIRLVCPDCNQWAFRECPKGWERIDRYGNVREHGTVYSRRELGQSGNPDDMLACCGNCEHEWTLAGRALEIALKGRHS